MLSQRKGGPEIRHSLNRIIRVESYLVSCFTLGMAFPRLFGLAKVDGVRR